MADMSMRGQDLRDELIRCRRGRALLASDIADRVGPQLRRLCGVADADSPAALRRKVHLRLMTLTESMPEDMRQLLLASFSLPPGPQDPFLKDRLSKVSSMRFCDSRTVRRRADEALSLLADLADTTDESMPRSDPDAADWVLDAVEAVVRLDQLGVEVIERRTVRAARNGLERIELSLCVPPHRLDSGRADGIELEPLHGMRVLEIERVGLRFFRWTLELPRPLEVQECHDVAVRIRLGVDRPIAPHYVLTPLRPCRSFRLLLQLPPGLHGAHVQRVDGLSPRVLDDPVPVGSRIAGDRFGMFRCDFTHLRPGLAYGAAWLPAGSG
ncbi:hypothetical protein QEZ54_17865 [Catellatospora sp. KI3]|uniref:hypothetical protein n=1 Tax=Catellatospora sp. KI3 TaxID=3041620 RepID=UPI002482A87B|nr:hypothetical protein [Catellatospora sp. KI3]MDI1462846.1 hypothetical protein [Catellatospora sp. KI3]